jgi:hypothetical protein
MAKYYFADGGQQGQSSFFRQLANQYLQQQAEAYNPDFTSNLPTSKNEYLEQTNQQLDELSKSVEEHPDDAEKAQSTATDIYYNRQLASIEDMQQRIAQYGTASGQNELLNKYDVKNKAIQQQQQAELAGAALGQALSLQATHYGFASDPYIDSNSLKGIGNRNNRLTPNTSVALSKETANQLGLKGGEQLLVTLPSGEQQQVTYDDTIPSGYKKERIDFYTPDGKLDFDGSQVQVQRILN